ncbi:MAG: alkaline phosphatase family protein [Clostridia bacterium]|nr:alkaline phosphatase family protein [Deltaproteobacteria bacterium]
MVLVGGVSPRVGGSPNVLKARAVADELREASPDAVILGLSLKDRGAILPSGHKPTATVWLDIDTGELTTSTYYSDKLPKWAESVSADIKRRVSEPWDLRDPQWLASHVLGPDDAPGEPPERRTFPHDLAKHYPIGAAIRLHPASDGMLVDLALAGIEAEYKIGKPLLVTLSFSTNDLIGHAFGPDSWEQWDELRRLDEQLARFFGELDKRFGADGYAVLLSADHGVSPMPEAQKLRAECAADAKPDPWERACSYGARMSRAKLALDVSAIAKDLLGDGAWTFGLVGAFVALTPEGRAHRAELVSTIIAKLEANPDVAHAIDVATLPAECPQSPTNLEGLVCNAYPPGSSGDIMVVLKPGVSYGDSYGASHGMPYTYDLTVPFLVRAPGKVKPGVVVEDVLPFATFTHTLAHLLGVKAPETAFAGAVIQ